MRNYIFTLLTASALVVSANAFAKDADDVAGHPRVNQINERIENQQKRIDEGVANGTINTKQEARDEKALTNVEKKLSEDEAKHKGHITKKEEHNLNKRLDKNSHRIHHQRHEGKERKDHK